MQKSKLFFSITLAVLCFISLSTQAQFTKITAPVDTVTNFIQLGDGGAAWGDYDADGDLDLVLTGRDNSFIAHLFIYRNNGDGTFSVADADTIPGTSLLGLDGGGVAWGDFDGDGDLDLAQNGFDDDPILPQRKTYVYKNNNGSFAPLLNPVDGVEQFLGTDDYDPNWVDVDLDGDLDLFYAESGSGEDNKGALYINNGDDTFTRNLTAVGDSTNFEGYIEGSSVWGDLDRDGDMDLFSNGSFGFQGINSTIYYNNGDGTFSLLKRGEDPTTFFSGTRIGAAELVDFDDDGLLDLFYTGETRGNSRRGDLYGNLGDGSFYFVANVQRGFRGFTGVLGYGASFGDYDGDGDSDLVYGGHTGTTRIVELWSNQGVFDFDKVLNPVDGAESFDGVSTREVLFGDYDGDGDLDVLVSGTRSDFSGYVSLYQNTTNHSNQPPSSPTGLQAEKTPEGVKFSWNSAIDDATLSGGLSYEVRVGTSAGASDILSAESVLNGDDEGRRLIPYRGRFQDTTLTLNLPAGTYFWSVQAVDAGLQGSVFASEVMSEVSDFEPSKPNPFSLLSPANGIDTLTKTPALFVWEKTTDDNDDSDSLEYKFDLAADSLFATMLESAALLGDTSYSATIALSSGEYFWRVSVTNTSDSTTWGSNSDQTPYRFTVIQATNTESLNQVPDQFILEQNYPNPFNPTTSIKYQLPIEGYVRLNIYDVMGREVATLVDEYQSAGVKTVQFDAKNLSSGIYFYSLESGSFSKTRRMMLIK